MNFEKIGLHVPQILLPNPQIDIAKWAVIACDQYTSQPSYWESIKNFVGNAPSTLQLVFPEIFLNSQNEGNLIQNIHQNMEKYCKEGILVPQTPGFILVERQLSNSKIRKGLIVALDLEKYDYTPKAQTLIRSTEGTILDRLPPRIKIRKKSVIEVPHILVLIDDPQHTVIDPLFEFNLPTLCDFELMMGHGRLKYYKIEQSAHIHQIAENLSQLSEPKGFAQNNLTDQKALLYALGDGNHSFATAKAIWETIKKEATSLSSILNHPARYVLVELVNVYDEGLNFEPIHRLIFNVSVDQMFQKMEKFFQDVGSGFSLQTFETDETLKTALHQSSTKPGNQHFIPFITEKQQGSIRIDNPHLNLTIETLQSFLDSFLKESSSSQIDYIHGDAVVESLGRQPGNIGFFLPAIKKEDFFKTVLKNGAFPQKTFSLGEAGEKRFYVECRKIQ